MKIPLQDLLPAPAMDEEPTPKEKVERGQRLRKIRAEAKARLVAQEYVRNGMDLTNAYNTVCQTNYPRNGKGHQTAYQLLGKSMDAFIDELNRIMAKTDISRERALSILWTMVNASILDFLDEHGNVLPVKELKKLPRVMQMLISEIEIKTSQSVAKDAEGKDMYDDMGRPYLVTKSHVKLKIPDKLTAFRHLAEVMRWIGPTVQINNFNIGSMMAEADAKAATLEQQYDYDGQYSEVREDRPVLRGSPDRGDPPE